jgi:hypothetical protein
MLPQIPGTLNFVCEIGKGFLCSKRERERVIAENLFGNLCERRGTKMFHLVRM